MTVSDASTMATPLLADGLYDWSQPGANMMSMNNATLMNGSTTRSPSSPDQTISPNSTNSSMDYTNNVSHPLFNSGLQQETTSKKRSASQLTSSTPLFEETDSVNKRQRNTEAARRYRQRKVDKLTDVEEALAEMTRERDELKLKLARSEAEAQVLRGMVRKD